MEEQYIFRTNVEKEYTVIRNSLITDKSLSWEARGILVYLLSKPETWVVRKSDLVAMSPISEYLTTNIIRELERSGYIKRDKHQDDKGRWTWHTWVYDKPIPQNMGGGSTIPQNTMYGKTMPGKVGNIVSTELKKTDQTNNGIKKIYIKKIGKLTPSKIKRFQNWEKLYSDKWILEAMDLAVQYNKKSFGYVQAILENWKANGRNGAKLTPENVDYLADEFAEFIEE